MNSKKIIVPIDIEKPEKKINDFLYPKITSNGAFFSAVKNQKEWKFGMVILKGGGITENELFTEIVNSKTKIESVERLLNTLIVYLEKIKDFSIGNIVCIESIDNEFGFVLKKHANRLNMIKNNKLP